MFEKRKTFEKAINRWLEKPVIQLSCSKLFKSKLMNHDISNVGSHTFQPGTINSEKLFSPGKTYLKKY